MPLRGKRRTCSSERRSPCWIGGAVPSAPREKTDAIRPPVAVLVNGETACAAEALAAVFRETGAGLIVGGKTAGQAMLAQEYPLKNGQRLRIATTPIKVGEATLMSAQGVKPDLAVEVSRDAERAYLADPFRKSSSPRPPQIPTAPQTELRVRTAPGDPVSAKPSWSGSGAKGCLRTLNRPSAAARKLKRQSCATRRWRALWMC